jgi:L-serine/L-threonine ammonia-lyase
VPGPPPQVFGENWNAADALARELVEKDPLAAYIPPYDSPLLWQGHSTLVDELVESGVKPGGTSRNHICSGTVGQGRDDHF